MSASLFAARVLPIASLLLLAGCFTRELAPPKPPDRDLPEVPDAPPEPPPGTKGRLLVDANGETATVSRIVELAPRDGSSASMRGIPAMTDELVGAKTESLCITPCALDLPNGAHTLVFSSTSDARRTSTTDVKVTQGTSVVRHAIGRRTPLGTGYVVGGIMFVAGMALTLFGAGATASDPRENWTIGVPVLGFGVALAAGGLILAMNNRPELQPGATTQFGVR
jgi:hypothetical protein